jgi:AcrR family transcriptional regulator
VGGGATRITGPSSVQKPWYAARADKQGKSAKWQARRHEIVDVSAKVFAERGYHATSTTELCDAKGTGKGALYY